MMAGFASDAFDRIAHQYDNLWTDTPVGIYQRQQIWQTLQPLLHRGDNLLDVGCGTGADGVWAQTAGLQVFGVDSSREMVQVARAKGVPSEHLAVENLAQLCGSYDAALSNFGVLNCIHDLRGPALQLGRLVRSGGHLFVCVIGAFCLWETCHFLRSGEFRKAFRRCSRLSASTSVGAEIRYFTVEEIVTAFQSQFELLTWKGVGLCVPPSYITHLSEQTIARLAKFDSRFAPWLVLRALADHRLLIFRRL